MNVLARRGALRALPLCLLAAPALAQAPAAWPERPVRLIVPFPPGQSTDIVARLVAEELSRRWPHPVVVENRGGGAGAPAMEAAARANDGHTLVAGSIGTMAINPAVLPRIGYDPERDFAPITNIAMVPLVLVAHPQSPVTTPQSLVEQARVRPGQLDVATAGPASGAHMAAELLAHRAGVRLNMVHYRGSGPATADLLAGTVRLMADSVASALPNIRAGRLRAVGVFGADRAEALPDVPTFAETVAPGVDAAGWNGLVRAEQHARGRAAPNQRRRHRDPARARGGAPPGRIRHGRRPDDARGLLGVPARRARAVGRDRAAGERADRGLTRGRPGDRPFRAATRPASAAGPPR